MLNRCKPKYQLKTSIYCLPTVELSKDLLGSQYGSEELLQIPARTGINVPTTQTLTFNLLLFLHHLCKCQQWKTVFGLPGSQVTFGELLT